MRLEQEGLLAALPNGGYAVRTFSERDVSDAIELRGTVEGLLARVAAERGAAPVVLGATQRVGGFLELALKRPDLDTRRGEVRVQGGSWDRFRQQLDYSTPIVNGVSALRLA